VSAPFAVRPRHLLALVAALALLAVVLLPSGAGAEPQAPDRELSVMTYNIHHGVGEDDVLDLQRIADEIRSSGVEVAGLQEVDRHWSARSDFVDQARWLADELGMHVVYGANLDRDPASAGEPRRQYGTAILSEFPVLSSRNTPLPRPQGGEQRGLLEAVINVRGVRVRVANTHLQHNSDVERTAQGEAIMDLLEGSEEPVVLLGDLNARPGDPELAPLAERYDDAWLEGGEGEGFTLSAADPYARIDYIFVSPQIAVESAVVRETLASDHLPVVAELALPGRLVGSHGSRTAKARG